MSDPRNRTGLDPFAAAGSFAAARGARGGRFPLAASLVLGALTVAIAWRYPLAPALVIALLTAYATALWRWPLLWLVAVPATLGGVDLGIWTGWTVIEEPDLVVLATVAVLLVRAPPARADLIPRGLSGAVIALAVVATVVGVVVGLARADLGAASAIAELSPFNPLRVAKGFTAALALLPFLRRAFRERDEAGWMLALGMSIGLALVSAATLAERILFTGPADFHLPYRVVGLFSSMHFGGGYIGVYVAMTLPFLLVPRPRARLLGAAGLIVVAAGGLYTLVVTFARAAYASATAAMLVAAVVASLAARRRGARVGAFVVPLALLLAVGTAVMTSARDARFMEHRLDRLHRDFAERLAEWHEGVALRDPGVATALFGMGLGRFAHTALVRRPGGRFPTDVTLPNESRRAFLHVRAGLPLYLGQKVHVAEHQLYRVRATVRTRDHGVLVVFLCEKLLLYSIHCRDIAFAPEATGAWERVDGILPSGRIGERAVHRFTRPVELSLFVPDRGTTLDIAEVSLTDTNGRELLVNGNFAHGLERWLPTDDDHKIWRIENQYLMTFFEGGALGLTALLVLAAVAMWRALHAATRGDPAAPALAASLTAVLLSSLFDCPLEVPRLAALFYLVAFAALALGERPVLCAAA